LALALAPSANDRPVIDRWSSLFKMLAQTGTIDKLDDAFAEQIAERA
jgi:hypothetical protein